MDKKTLMEYIPERTLMHKGRTLQAVYIAFLEGLPVEQAAIKAGITKQAANRPIQRTKANLLKNGFRSHTVWIGPDEEINIRKKNGGVL